jgi:NAD(P)-dependent dehydrogenase (short-subunit alcohol dehydrogenase family)
MASHWPWNTSPVCLVTGGARGLGLEVAVGLARQGATVLVGGRDPAAVAKVVEERRGDSPLRALDSPLDISDDRQVAAAADAVRDGHGRLDVLINNAAAYVDWSESASGADLEQSRAVMEVNLYGAWRMIQAFRPLLTASGHPRVVNVASGAGSHGDPKYGLTARGGAAASYGISKAALLALTASLAAEWADTPIMVNAVDPDLTATWPGAEAMGGRPAEVSAAGVIWAATLPDDGPRGGFFRDTQPLAW